MGPRHNRKPVSPRVALSRWLSQLHYNHIRNIERLYPVERVDRKMGLRGVLVADDLCLTRKRTFFKINGERAEPISIETVAANYDLASMQAMYRTAMDSWRNLMRRRVG